MFSSLFQLLSFLLLINFGSSILLDPPQCASACLNNVSGTNCKISNWNCLCFAEVYADNLAVCLDSACSPREKNNTLTLITTTCKLYTFHGPFAHLNTTDNASTTSPGVPQATLNSTLTTTISLINATDMPLTSLNHTGHVSTTQEGPMITTSAGNLTTTESESGLRMPTGASVTESSVMKISNPANGGGATASATGESGGSGLGGWEGTVVLGWAAVVGLVGGV